MKKRCAAIVQARMSSKRLPGKSLMTLGDKPIIQHVFDRLKLCKSLDVILLATTDNPADQKLVNYARGQGLEVFVGDEDNVLKRFVDAAAKVHADEVVRVCGDNVFLAPMEVDRLLESHFTENAEYTTNSFDDGTLAVLTGCGFAVEVVSAEALQRVQDVTKDKVNLEHVTPYIYKNANEFRMNIVKLPEEMQLDGLRTTVDNLEDLENVNQIYANVPELNPKNIIDYVRNENDLLLKMKHISEHNVKKV